MKKFSILIAILTSFSCLCGCAGSNAPLPKLEISITEYSEASSTESKITIDLKKGAKYLISEKHDTEFKIKKITPEYIIIKTNNSLSASQDESAGIDMHSEQTEFTCRAGETWYLRTQSYDAGENYSFQYNGY